MRTGEIIWDASYQNKWCVSSVQQDFYRVLEHFVDEFNQEVISVEIQPLTNAWMVHILIEEEKKHSH